MKTSNNLIGYPNDSGILNCGRVVVGCVADNSVKYLDQALRLLQSWRWFAGSLADASFHVCVVDEVPAAYREEYESYGACVHIVSRFSAVHPPSNKLRFLELPLLADAARVILLDCDTVIVQEPMGLLSEADFAAKIADFPTVTHEIFKTLFSVFGVSLPEATERCTVHGEPILPYFNAGVLSFSGNAMDLLVPEWVRINRELTNRLDLLGPCGNFCEQASLSLALAKCGTSFHALDNRLNFPAHCVGEPLDSEFAETDPVIIHYHWLVDEQGLLKMSPYQKLNARIESFNIRLRQERRRHFDNRSFWNVRYSRDPELGSGIGSRGQLAIYKQALLSSVIADINPATILDIGCGDMTVGAVLPEQGYTGVDISSVVIDGNASTFPERRFLCGDFTSMAVGKHDLVLCLDLLIHIPSRSEYLKCVAKCVESANVVGVIAAYDAPPTITSEITFFYEPISETLAAAGAMDIREIGAYNQVRVFQFRKKTNPTLGNSSKVEHPLARPIFLVGTMRSGTTLLADLLGDSPKVAHCPFELKDVWSREGGVAMASPKTRDHICPECGAGDVIPGMKGRLIEAFAARMVLLPEKSGHAVFMNKNPHLCNKLKLVESLFPDARFIWVHRHLPQVVASLKRLFADVCERQTTWHWWPLPSVGVRNRCWNASYCHEGLIDIHPERIFPGGNVRYLAEYWLESNRAVAEFFFSVASSGKCITVAEESIIAAPGNQLSHLYGLLQLPFLSEKNPKLDTSRNDHWKELLNEEELCELRRFIEIRGREIDEIFPGEGRSQHYMRQLENITSSARLKIK